MRKQNIEIIICVGNEIKKKIHDNMKPINGQPINGNRKNLFYTQNVQFTQITKSVLCKPNNNMAINNGRERKNKINATANS